MKYQLSKITVRDTALSVKEAEARLERPEVTDGRPVYVDVRPQDIRTRLELFQPRRPGWGTRELETRDVNRLAKRIKQKGELDPVLVIKLETANPYTGELDGHEWVVVDGHHRIAAYLKLKWPGTIKCEWYAGTVREATDESLRRNEIIHKEIQQGDKWEEAWKRVLLGWGSKREIVQLTGTSDGIVGRMRRAMNWHQDQVSGNAKSPMGEKLVTAFGADLRVHSWAKVNRVILDLTPKEWNVDDAAAKLSGQLSRRMTNLLSNDPEVTARALWLYDRDMCPTLVEALQARIQSAMADEEDGGY
jgi:ParB-like chromosome segregation protein Spo0J